MTYSLGIISYIKQCKPKWNCTWGTCETEFKPDLKKSNYTNNIKTFKKQGSLYTSQGLT